MRKLGVVEGIVGVGTVLFLAIWVPVFVNTMSEGPFLTAAIKQILWPLDGMKESLLTKQSNTLYILFLLLAIVWLWVSPLLTIAFLVERWRGRKTNRLPQILAEQQLVVVLRELNARSGTTVISEQTRRSVVSLIKHFEKGVQDMFNLKNHNEYHMIWYVATSDPLRPQYWSKKGLPPGEDAKLVKWAFDQDWLTSRDDVQRSRLYNGTEVEAVVSARNVDEFQIGFACLIYNKKRIPLEKVTEFRTAAASLLMLGQMDNIREAMLQLTPEDFGAVANP